MPLWPNLQPRSTDPLWFNADRPIDDESEVAALEQEHQQWVYTFSSYFKNNNVILESFYYIYIFCFVFQREHIRTEGSEHVPIGKDARDVS